MSAESNISGIHHITAVASSAAENLYFYENVLGLRLVKQTVNFDDPYTYHLYYGDAQGSPGTILTFFPWEKLPQGKPGAGMVTAVNFAVSRGSMDFWSRRLRTHDISFQTVERFGDPVIRFTDPHGLPLELTGSGSTRTAMHWDKGPISRSHAITGFHSATATLTSLEKSRLLLVDLMGLPLEGQEGNRYRFQMAGSAGGYYDVVVDPDAPSGRPGGGTIHHIAFRTLSDATQAGWQSMLRASGLGVTEVRDRKYFRSIYFHAPEGVLFEIATDPPGFTVDESLEELGAVLRLPEPLETRRSDIERRLPPLRSRGHRHAFQTPRRPGDDGDTLVTLHGTGGTEQDLIPLAMEVSPTSAILSPRGNVVENGMPRFFRRLSNHIFDQEDVIARAHSLADFVVSAGDAYGRDPARMTALGYSNGANIAAAVLLLRPEVFSRAILLRPMLPLQTPDLPDLRGKKILMLRGKQDTVIPPDRTDRLEQVLRSAGADVTSAAIDAGHEITVQDVQKISRWMAAKPATEQKDAPTTLSHIPA